MHLPSARLPGRLLAWTAAAGSSVALQAGTQALNVLAGIALVRTLPPNEFAVYTLAVALQGTLGILCDAGLGNAMFARGGQQVHRPAAFAGLLATTLRLRRGLVTAVLVPGLPLAALGLWRGGASWPEAAGLGALLAAGLGAQASSSVHAAALRLQLRASEAQGLELAAAAARAALLGLCCAAWPRAAGALAATVLVLGWQAHALRARLALPAADGAEEPADRDALLAGVRQQFLPALFVAVQGQALVWLAAWLGTGARVADVGALGRFAALFAVGSALLTNLVFPRFARLEQGPRISRLYFGTLAAVAGGGAAAVGVGLAAPGLLLWVLGPSYAHLGHALPLSLAGGAVLLLANAAYGLNASRGWLAGSWLYIPLTLGVQAWLLRSLHVDTLEGTLWFGLLSTLPALLLNLALGCNALRAPARGETALNPRAG
jgi:hypothetical protein